MYSYFLPSDNGLEFVTIQNKICDEFGYVLEDYLDINNYNIHLLWEPMIVLWCDLFNDHGIVRSNLVDISATSAQYIKDKAERVKQWNGDTTSPAAGKYNFNESDIVAAIANIDNLISATKVNDSLAPAATVPPSPAASLFDLIIDTTTSSSPTDINAETTTSTSPTVDTTTSSSPTLNIANNNASLLVDELCIALSSESLLDNASSNSLRNPPVNCLQLEIPETKSRILRFSAKNQLSPRSPTKPLQHEQPKSPGSPRVKRY